MARKNLLKGFKKPKGITFEHSESESNYGRFIAYPFERGYGTTIGNTLRRILLSSIQGYAVSALRITSYDEEGTPHLISSDYERSSLMISGHTHGGQIALFGKALFTPNGSGQYTKGWYVRNQDMLYVMRGIGSSYRFPIRIGVKPEILVLDIN